jgi:hypothetical protein
MIDQSHYGYGQPIPDEVRRFLEIDIDDDDDRDRYLGNPPSGTEVVILQLTTSGEINKFAKGTVVSVLGMEIEGKSAQLSTLDNPGIFAANLGTAVAPIGTRVMAVRVPNRWVYIYNG